jgi:hypothetical protein
LLGALVVKGKRLFTTFGDGLFWVEYLLLAQTYAQVIALSLMFEA